MNAETKIYSDFIKRNKIVANTLQKSDGVFALYYEGVLKVVPLRKCTDTGRYFAGRDNGDVDNGTTTKKAAIYWYCKNHFPNLK